MKKRMSLFSAAAAAVILGASLLLPSPGAAKTIKLNYANFPPAPTFPCVQMERWKVEVEKRTAGKVKVNTFPGSTLLGPKDMMDGVISGQADIGCVSTSYQPGRFTVTNAAGLPLGVTSSRMGSLMLWDFFDKYRPKELSKVKVLTMFTSAPSNIMARKAVRNLADIKGLDLRASGGAAQTLKAWGANQIGMPMSATPEALQKGIVQGLFSSLEVLKDLKFAETCRYVTVTNGVIYPFAVVMNMDRWNALPEDVKKVFDDLSREQAEWTGTYMDNHAVKAVDWSKKTHNVEFIELPAEEKAKWNGLLAPIVDGWVKDAKAKGLPAEEIVKDLKGLVKKHS